MRPTLRLDLLTTLCCFSLVHCQGETPANFVPSFDSDSNESADSDFSEETDSFPTDDWDTSLEISTDTDAETETESESESATSAPWWKCTFSRRREIVISNASQISPRHALSFVLDHKYLVSNNISRSDGKDVRILHWDEGSYHELPRVVGPRSNWNGKNTRIWFSLPQSTFSTSGTEKIYLYFGNSTPNDPPDRESEVFRFADFFERGNGSFLGEQWEEYSISGTDIVIKEGALHFKKMADAVNRPGVDGVFDALSGRLTLQFGFDWSLNGYHRDYRVHIQLGDSLQMETIPRVDVPSWFSNAGVGPSLLWSSPSDGMDNHQGFGYEVDGWGTEIASVQGAVTIRADVDLASKTYSLSINKGAPTENIPFSRAIDAIDTLRIFTWQVNTGSTLTSSFSHIMINKVAPTVPIADVENSVSENNGPWCQIK